jgi:hypothetical protein
VRDVNAYAHVNYIPPAGRGQNGDGGAMRKRARHTRPGAPAHRDLANAFSRHSQALVDFLTGGEAQRSPMLNMAVLEPTPSAREATAVLDDCYPVAQTFGLLHPMKGQKEVLPRVADATHQAPDRLHDCLKGQNGPLTG